MILAWQKPRGRCADSLTLFLLAADLLLNAWCSRLNTRSADMHQALWMVTSGVPVFRRRARGRRSPAAGDPVALVTPPSWPCSPKLLLFPRVAARPHLVASRRFAFSDFPLLLVVPASPSIRAASDEAHRRLADWLLVGVMGWRSGAFRRAVAVCRFPDDALGTHRFFGTTTWPSTCHLRSARWYRLAAGRTGRGLPVALLLVRVARCGLGGN